MISLAQSSALHSNSARPRFMYVCWWYSLFRTGHRTKYLQMFPCLSRLQLMLSSAANSMNMSLLSISVGAILLPAVYHFSLSGNEENVISASQKQSILHMSHSVSSAQSRSFQTPTHRVHRFPLFSFLVSQIPHAIVIAHTGIHPVYIASLVFQLWSHDHLYHGRPMSTEPWASINNNLDSQQIPTLRIASTTRMF